jgi:hypothetical protein
LIRRRQKSIKAMKQLTTRQNHTNKSSIDNIKTIDTQINKSKQSTTQKQTHKKSNTTQSN